MSTIPLRIDTDLVNVAREAASLMERTPTAQIEFWAKLGRAMEAVMTHEGVVAAKEASQVRNLDSLLAIATSPEGQKKALAEIHRHKGPTYGTDPSRPGVLVEIRPDGSRRHGKFVNRRFMPLEGLRAE